MGHGMDLDLLGRLGWREGLIAIIVLLVLYIVVLFVRMRRLQDAAVAMPSPAAQSAVAAYTAIQESGSAEPPVQDPPLLPQQPADALPPAAAEPAVAVRADAGRSSFPWNEPPPQIPGQELIDALQRDVYQLRCEVDELRAEVLAAREDFRQVAKGTAPSAPPLYNDAMQMAIQGHDATAIAHRCGIARAEADLVVALARNRRDGH
ncbi:DUF2802 domain-containing protein [Accumulibacter sp.]|uniref:DUF2802 domain-containing protein n=1 Tax=Accumulibacter sp. TaxID=2053492 RepID=UPI0025E602DA|nr:DUF2802 domain-containing protein [Accumulibacter sp.]MCM8613785.1 DUF2802 domain-containing protein [Accumulibacter sp.]MCM8637451.1 DUF2802 domain-containing protein [Accumulibacter sp.]MCM8641498.1 DUF2802 domain-containing protein [Accumulibacter sp.]